MKWNAFTIGGLCMNYSYLFFILGFLIVLGIFLLKIWIGLFLRFKWGQTPKSYGPERHLVLKAGTPTMGGVIFVVLTFIASFFLNVKSGNAMETLILWWLPLGGAVVGFVDDFIKLSKRSSEGLTSRAKLFGQIIVVLPWAWIASREINLFFSQYLPAIPSGLAFIFLAFFALGLYNALNITDGLDGLAAGASAISLVILLLVSNIDSCIISIIIGLACTLSFLWYNSHPAKVFMGDVGAHFIAGLLMGNVALSGRILLIFPVSLIFGIEIVSVILQVISFRCFGKRIFKMSPLHHHFELCGWPEGHIVIRFWLVHLVGASFLMALLARQVI